MNEPHGGKLINRINKSAKLAVKNISLKIIADNDQVSEIRNIAVGLYSPLEGYMNQDDFESVVSKMELANGLPWSIPVFLPLTEAQWKKVKPGSQIQLMQQLGKNEEELAILNVEDKFKYDQHKYCKNVYGTNDIKHPGVERIMQLSPYAVGGEIWMTGKYKSQYPDYDFTPVQTRKVFEDKGWKTIVGFQTRNAAHRAHEFVQKLALEFVDGLFVNPIIGSKKPGDFKDEVILDVYTNLVKQFYPPNSTHIGIYRSRMNYAGPREAVFHSIVRKNFGCTHFIVGRDHAGVGDYYDKFAAHKIFDKIEGLGMEIMKVSDAFFCRRCDLYTTGKICPHNQIYRVSPSGTQVRQYITEKNYEALRRIMRDDVLDIIFKYEHPFVE